MLAYYTIAACVFAFVIGTIWNYNIGILCIAFGFLASVLNGGMGAELFKATSVPNIFLFVGVNFLFTLALKNGSIQRLCETLLRVAGGRRWLMPFAIALGGGAISCCGPAGVPTVAFMSGPTLAMAKKANISPFLMIAVVMHGIFAGMYSPISTFAIPVFALLLQSGFDIAGRILLWTAVVEILAAVIAFCLFGGLRLIKEDKEEGGRIEVAYEGKEQNEFKMAHFITFASIIGLLIGVLFLKVNLGFLSIVLGVICLSFSYKDGLTDGKIIKDMPWSTIVLVIGAMTLMNMMADSGGVKLVVDGIKSLNIGLVGALLMIIAAALTSFYASSQAIILAILPMGMLLMQEMGMPELVPGMAIAICVAATIVDISPVSASGALMTAAAAVHIETEEEKNKLFKKLFAYGFSLIFISSIILWAIFILL
jgi:di/tricarboxylate transporter